MRRLDGLILDVDDLVCEMAELLPGYLSDRVYDCRCKKISKDLAGNVRFKHFIRGKRLPLVPTSKLFYSTPLA